MAAFGLALAGDLLFAPPADAACGVIEALLADAPYVVTHGDLVEAVTSRSEALRRAAETARDQRARRSGS